MNRTQWQSDESTSIAAAVVINTITLGFVQSAVFLFAYFFFPQPEMWIFFQPRHLGAHSAFAVVVVGYRTKSQMNVHETSVMERGKVTLFSLWHYCRSDKWIDAKKTIAGKKTRTLFAHSPLRHQFVPGTIGGRVMDWNGMGSSIHSFDLVPDWGRDDIQFMHRFICAD